MRETRSDDIDIQTVPGKDKVVRVEPQTGRAVSLGVYAEHTPDPDFDISLEPPMEDEIGIAISRLDIPEQHHYIMMLQLHNFGSKPCNVRVRPTEK